MSKSVRCPNTNCPMVLEVQENQTSVYCTGCNQVVRLVDGKESAIVLASLSFSVRLAVVLWLPFMILAALLLTLGSPSRVPLAACCVLIPGLAFWYWMQDIKRRATGSPIAIPGPLLKLLGFVAVWLRWGFGWFLTSLGRKLYYTFLKMVGEHPSKEAENRQKLQYKVVFAVSYAIAFCLLGVPFLFLWVPPTDGSIFLWNFLSLGIPFETGISIGFLLSFGVWPVMLVAEKLFRQRVKTPSEG